MESADVIPPVKDPWFSDDPYEPPHLTYLGTLRELTLGGTVGPDDGNGGAGDVGSL